MAALRKCLEENKGDHAKCQEHIDAFHSYSINPLTPPPPSRSPHSWRGLMIARMTWHRHVSPRGVPCGRLRAVRVGHVDAARAMWGKRLPTH
ncbi:hypothetical protein E2562_003981 [Oryza meyeriana var. granulata]|uniref:Uncharacterized protein n=1 Tax=Oryza meyeriana var. granulata TaxID=110450 RepID=A0A6G1BI63_9ORYZ|nr:hypothetical protein E2562_003981 [Oryza meyeriana var. granulata]